MHSKESGQNCLQNHMSFSHHSTKKSPSLATHKAPLHLQDCLVGKYKYLHTNCPKYFSPFLKVRQCAYNTRLSQSDGIILHVPQYQPSIYKSTKQSGLSFAYDAPKIWNELSDNVRSATSIASFRKNLRHTYSAKLILLSIFHLIWRSPWCRP